MRIDGFPIDLEDTDRIDVRRSLTNSPNYAVTINGSRGESVLLWLPESKATELLAKLRAAVPSEVASA